MDTTLKTCRWTSLACGLLALVAMMCVSIGTAAQASAVDFNPQSIISDANMRDHDSMSEGEIKVFLEARTGLLDTLVTTDYAGVNMPASRIISEACQAWKISPKVMLTMLQKEQSLLTRTTLSKNTLSRAIGAGCPNATTNRYPGFGQQMWNGARLFNSYGEGNPSFPTFYPGIKKAIYEIDGMTHIHPENLATFKLYVYNPSIGAKIPYGDLSTQACSGNANFWKIYRKYFGDPLSDLSVTWVIISRAGAHGTISPAATQTVVSSADATFTFTPDSGYRIADVKVDGVSKGAIASYTFADVSASHTISATFAVNRISAGTPKAPRTVKRSRSFTVYGYLTPRHKAGTYPVRIYKERKVAGKWKKAGYVKAKASNFKTYTKYSVKMKLTRKGQWRLRAYIVKDSKHLARMSAKYDNVTVK